MLRNYQQKLKDDVYDSWREGLRNVIAVAPTGAGKTRIMSNIFADWNDPCIAIAHRQELVGQISCALAEEGVYHNVIASTKVIRFCISQHIKLFEKNYHHASSPVAVASVQTLNARPESLRHKMTMWAGDEAHHFLPKNTWGKAVSPFADTALGVGFTATPRRLDKQPLGRKFGGLFDHMVLGPSMRELINMGHLSDYRIFAPKSSIDWSHVSISKSTGNYKDKEKVEATMNSTVVGDIVSHYLKIAPGKLGITFLPSVEQCKEMAARFVAAGVPAESVSGASSDEHRQRSIDSFKRGELKQLVNVGLFGEGFDVPGVEVVSDGDGTLSFTDFAQRFGRMMRTAPGKTHGIYIDHVENVIRHGLPDAPRNWTLDVDYRGTSRKADPNVVPVRQCLSCDGVYEALTRTCPYCGHVDMPVSRDLPEMVDGDLLEFSPELLAKLRGEIQSVEDGWHGSVNDVKEASIRKGMNLRSESLRELQQTIDMWAGVWCDGDLSKAYARFYHTYGIDVLTAQTLTRSEMIGLTEKIRNDIM